jgi:hypothetical protein
MRLNLPSAARAAILIMLATLLGGCSMSMTPVANTVAPSETPAVSDLHLTPTWAQGRVRFYLVGPADGLEVFWLLPQDIKGTLVASVNPAVPYPQVYWYHGSDVPAYLAPSGAPRSPRVSESADSGVLECVPTSDPKVVRFTLTDLHFKSLNIPKLGPFNITLDGSPAP